MHMITIFYYFVNIYSVRRASTGSFFDAIRAGIKPAINVRTTLITINAILLTNGNDARPDTPVKALSMALIGSVNNKAINIPNTPATNPIMVVSALNTFDTSRLLAPTERNTPISLVLSITEVYVIIPIITLETTSDIDAKAIKTYDIVSTNVPKMSVNN